MGFFDKILGLGQKTDTKTVVMQKIASDVINETVTKIQQTTNQSMKSNQRVNAGGEFEFINTTAENLNFTWDLSQSNIQGLRMVIAQTISNTTDTEQKAEVIADIEKQLEQAAQIFSAQCANSNTDITQEEAFSVANSVVNDLKKEMNQALTNNQDIDAHVKFVAKNSTLKNINMNWNVEQVNNQYADLQTEESVKNDNKTKQSGSSKASEDTSSSQTKKFSLGEFLGDGLFGGIKNILLYGIIAVIVLVIAIVIISMVGGKKSDNMQQAMMQRGMQMMGPPGPQPQYQPGLQPGPQPVAQPQYRPQYQPGTQPQYQPGPQSGPQSWPQSQYQPQYRPPQMAPQMARY